MDVLWKDWCWSWNSNTLATWFEELTHWKKSCAMQWSKEMVFLSKSKPSSILGTVTDEWQMSIKDRLLRKKYMGVWRRGVKTMVTMIRMFPKRVSTYMTENAMKNNICSTQLSVSPKKTNWVTLVWFRASIQWASKGPCGGKKKHEQ